MAISKNYITIVYLLISKGYTISSCSKETFNLAVSKNYASIIYVLVNKGYNVDNCSKKTFNLAINKNYVTIVNDLIENNYFSGNCFLETFLNLSKNCFIFKLLVKKGYSENNYLKYYIKKNILTSLISAIRSRQINYSIAIIIIKYCGPFFNKEFIEKIIFNNPFVNRMSKI